MGRPTLPLEARAEIEKARKAILDSRQTAYSSLFFSGVAHFVKAMDDLGAFEPTPALLQLELQQYSCALFDAEARVYIKHAGSEAELREWLNFLAIVIEKSVMEDIKSNSSWHDRHCSLAERQAAAGDALPGRIGHWIEAARRDFDATIRRGQAALGGSKQALADYQEAQRILSGNAFPVMQPQRPETMPVDVELPDAPKETPESVIPVQIPNPWAIWETNRNLPDTTAVLRLYNACKTFREKTDTHIFRNKGLWRTIEKHLTPGQMLSTKEPNPEAMLGAFCKHCQWFLSEISEAFIDHIARRGLTGKAGIDAFNDYAKQFTGQAFENNWKWGLGHLRLNPQDDFYRSIATEVTEGKVQHLRLLWPERDREFPGLTTGHRTSISDQLDDARLKADISHEEQADRIGISRTTYFEVKAGRGGRKARRKVSLYLTRVSSETSSTKPD